MSVERFYKNELHELSYKKEAGTTASTRQQTMTNYEATRRNGENRGLLMYKKDVSRIKSMLETDFRIQMLAGLEMEWFLDGIPVADDLLRQFDFVLMAYHGRQLSNPQDAEKLLHNMIDHTCTDVIAHPDAFLGDFDSRRCDWQTIFNRMEEREIICEYNLTSPLAPELFDVANTYSDVRFAISSDIHDFRDVSTRRLNDAWSESCAGGFDIAFDYLYNIMSVCYSGFELDELVNLFSTPEKLSKLEHRVYFKSRGDQIHLINFDETEKNLFLSLRAVPFGQPDRDFLLKRLHRFIDLPSERIATILPISSFIELIHSARAKRMQ